MKITQRKDINLINYGNSPVAVTGAKREYLLEGVRDGVPVVYYFDWDEIEAINSRCSAIKNGLLSFAPEDRAEAYTALKYLDWEASIIFDETIEDIISNPTIPNLERILCVKDTHTIERFRGKVLSYINTGRGIDSRFIDVVNGRYREICNGITQSKIFLRPVDSDTTESVVAELKEKNDGMEKELAEMRAQMAELLKAQKTSDKKNAKPE